MGEKFVCHVEDSKCEDDKKEQVGSEAQNPLPTLSISSIYIFFV